MQRDSLSPEVLPDLFIIEIMNTTQLTGSTSANFFFI